VLNGFNSKISAHCHEFSQNRWFFAILPNSGGFANFPHKCGGFLELTRGWAINASHARGQGDSIVSARTDRSPLFLLLAAIGLGGTCGYSLQSDPWCLDGKERICRALLIGPRPTCCLLLLLPLSVPPRNQSDRFLLFLIAMEQNQSDRINLHRIENLSI
jgi:hypothetical protein